MSLHELCAASRGGEGQRMEPAWALALAASFGSVERWREEFAAMGAAHDAGWLLLVFEPSEGRLSNQWAADPAHVLPGSVPVLALDRRAQGGHGVAAGSHVDAFIDDIDWAAVYGRYQKAVHAASEAWGVDADEIGDALLFDVRRAAVFEQARTMIEGARWRDPVTVSAWAAQLPAARKLVVYCVYGHEVGRATAMRLRAAGLDARYLRGGIEGWQAAGRPLGDKDGWTTP
jgi:Fe-Mn family superoxide dismutase